MYSQIHSPLLLPLLTERAKPRMLMNQSRLGPCPAYSSHSVESPAKGAAMRCLSPARRMPGSVFFVEKRPDNKMPQQPTDWKEAAYSVRWEEFVAHSASVTCLALGRKSGRVMVTGGEDKKVNLWAVGKSNCIMSLSGHTSSVSCVKFGHCEDIVCAGAASGALKIWDLDAAKIIRTLIGHKGKVNCVDFHPYGDFVASGSCDSSIKLWDKRRKGSIFTYKGHSKSVNTLKFSPDGRWIASGCDDGIVKLWDLPAGKLRTEYKAHTSSVTDIEFHPNELLLASCSSDQYVKFWDLENHRIVSSSDGDSGPVQKIYFGPNGTCLFSGAQDILKVYAWEPIRTLDTLVMGWGQVSDIASSESQLIVGAFSLTNVSVYLMDLKKIQPVDTWLKQTAILRSAGSDSGYGELMADIDVDNPQIIDYRGQSDYLSNYNPMDSKATRGQSAMGGMSWVEDFQGEPKPYLPCDPTICTDIDLSKTQVVGVDLSAFLPPLEDVPNIITGESAFIHPLNCTYRLATVQGKPTVLALPTAIAHPYNYEKDKIPESSEVPELNILPILPKEAQNVQFPDLGQRCEVEIVQTRNKPFGIELDDFLPRGLLESSKSGHSTLEMSDAEAISSIYRGHDSMTKVLSHRKRYLISVIKLWRAEGPIAGLTSAVHMSDSAILVDLLTLLISKPSSWTLDICQLLLPVICDLLKSKYETYITVGCMSLKLIMKNFSHVIKINITAPKGVGIDITREERYKKCRTCYNHLMSLRAFIVQSRSNEGQLGKLFMELSEMLQSFER